MVVKHLKELTFQERTALCNRFGEDFASILVDTVIPIVNEVKKNGDAAVKAYTRKFDGIALDSLLVTDAEFDESFKKIDRNVFDAFLEAKKNIEEFHSRQLKNVLSYTRNDGTTLGVYHHPIERAAIYVPGGKASYPSSVLMGVIPAKIAGVKDITLITPPTKEGTIHPMVLSLCRELGVSRVVKAGGAHGVAAAGIGTETVNKADIIVGPGNIYVTAAKTYLFSLGLVQIDSPAGPSEVLIVADETANPKWVAWDLLSQAEHEEMAQAVLVTTSEKIAHEVIRHINEDIESGSGRCEIKKKAIERGCYILIAETIGEAIEFSNQYGPEHMELMVTNPMDYLSQIKNVGSLFLGHYSPVAVGDYYSGTNHILPTGGAARFSSGVSVDTFLRRTTFQMLTADALAKARVPIALMSVLEGFGDKHGGSVEIRFTA
ncbi:MAG: histidinol dehydrogenase [Spirochaetes bacterium]|nr:histidinol dehydrogenase [Spirochaetota bacterium]